MHFRGPRQRWNLLLITLTTFSTVYAAEPLTVTFSAADGLNITADFYPPPPDLPAPAPLVILLHNEKSDRHAWHPLIPALEQARCAILALDLRGHGDSATTESRSAAAKRSPALFRSMQDDLRGAYDWLARQPDLDRTRFALVGEGLGCSVALQYAAHDRSVDVIVGLSPALDDVGLSPTGDIRQLTGRRILLVGRINERDQLYTLRDRGHEVEAQVLPGKKPSGAAMIADVRHLEKQIARFIAKGVGQPTETTVFGSINSNIYHLPDSGWLERIAPTNLRCYSSPAEAQARGLRAARSKGPRQGHGS